MKKYKIIITSIIILLATTGCNFKNENSSQVISNGKAINTSSMKHKHCTRQGKVEGGSANLSYELFYTGENLNILKSEEQIISNDKNILKTYEDAYRKIHKNYEGLQYYDAEVVLGDTSVTSIITINYDKINIKKLLAIEGEEDNIIENGTAKVSKWLELSKKFGTKCEEVED